MGMIFIVICFFAFQHNIDASDSIIWQKEISIGSDSSCMPAAMIVNEKNNEVIVLGMPVEAAAKALSFWLWRIEPNGNIKKRETLDTASKKELSASRASGLIAAILPDTSDIVRLKISDGDSGNMFLSTTTKDMQNKTVKFDADSERSKVFLLNDMAIYQKNNLLFTGQQDQNGVIIKADLSGRVLWKKIVDFSQTNVLSSIACAPDGRDFYVSGLSFTMSPNLTLTEHYKVRILRYDENGKIKARDFFEGGIIPFPAILPKVLCLPSGVVLVVNDKNSKNSAAQMYVNAYSAELQPLYEKQIVKAKEGNFLTEFDICAAGRNHFVLAEIEDPGILNIFEYDEDANILQTVQLKGAVTGGRIFVGCLNGVIFAAFTEKTKTDDKKVHIKLLALNSFKSD